MDLDLLERRHAVLAWRDDLIMAVWSIVNRAGMEAKRGVEERLAEAGIVETLWDPTNFTRERVDRVMHKLIAGELEKLCDKAADELRMIDTEYNVLADALVESLIMLNLPSPEPALQSETNVNVPGEPIAVPSGRLANMIETISNQKLVKSAKEWSGWALLLAGEARETASQKLQSGVGLHDRLRRSAQARIESAWMAPASDPLPLMGQFIAVVDRVSSEARSMAI